MKSTSVSGKQLLVFIGIPCLFIAGLFVGITADRFVSRDGRNDFEHFFSIPGFAKGTGVESGFKAMFVDHAFMGLVLTASFELLHYCDTERMALVRVNSYGQSWEEEVAMSRAGANKINNMLYSSTFKIVEADNPEHKYTIVEVQGGIEHNTEFSLLMGHLRGAIWPSRVRMFLMGFESYE